MKNHASSAPAKEPIRLASMSPGSAPILPGTTNWVHWLGPIDATNSETSVVDPDPPPRAAYRIEVRN